MVASAEDVSRWLGSQLIAMKQMHGEEPKEKWDRLEKMFRILMRMERPHFQHHLQRPYSFYLPGLSWHMFWEKKRFETAKILEERYEDIKEELFDALEREKTGKMTLNFARYEGDGDDRDKG